MSRIILAAEARNPECVENYLRSRWISHIESDINDEIASAAQSGRNAIRYKNNSFRREDVLNLIRDDLLRAGYKVETVVYHDYNDIRAVKLEISWSE